MDAITLLEADHKAVKGLFEEFRSAGEGAHRTKEGIANRAFVELIVHTKLEEEIFYPAVREQGRELADMIAEATEEHHVVDLLIAELEKLSSDDERYDAKFTVLMENVEHHVKEEEGELFPKAGKALRSELAQLGEQMAERKVQLKAETKSAAAP
jgi:hemerythrin superfamily protein